jgi:hypothetical protein
MVQQPCNIEQTSSSLCVLLSLEDFKNGAAFRETDEGVDYSTLMQGLLTGEFGQVLRVVAFNPTKAGHAMHPKTSPASSSGASLPRAARSPKACRIFIEGQLGGKIGVQLPLH